MTITQLQYILAIVETGSFQAAADKVFVTQPTLSQQVKKLEDELGVVIFNRGGRRVKPTPVGERILEQARRVTKEAELLKNVVGEESKLLHGDVRLAVIPTLAPMLLPRFVREMKKTAPLLNLQAEERQTDEIVAMLKSNQIDVGLLVTPLNLPGIKEEVLFSEPLVAFFGQGHPLLKKKYVRETDLDRDEVFLMSEGHCFRAHALELCKRRKTKQGPLKFESGSLHTLKNMVNEVGGFTLLPEMWFREILSPEEKRRVRRFSDPQPTREVSLVYAEPFIRHRALEAMVAAGRKQL